MITGEKVLSKNVECLQMLLFKFHCNWPTTKMRVVLLKLMKRVWLGCISMAELKLFDHVLKKQQSLSSEFHTIFNFYVMSTTVYPNLYLIITVIQNFLDQWYKIIYQLRKRFDSFKLQLRSTNNCIVTQWMAKELIGICLVFMLPVKDLGM